MMLKHIRCDYALLSRLPSTITSFFLQLRQTLIAEVIILQNIGRGGVTAEVAFLFWWDMPNFCWRRVTSVTLPFCCSYSRVRGLHRLIVASDIVLGHIGIIHFACCCWEPRGRVTWKTTVKNDIENLRCCVARLTSIGTERAASWETVPLIILWIYKSDTVIGLTVTVCELNS